MVHDLADAEAGPSTRWLDEDGISQSPNRLLTGRPVKAPFTVADHRIREYGQPVRLQDQLHVVLVHADSAGQHASAHIANGRHLEQPLDRPVLPPRTMQQREDDIDLPQCAGHLPWLSHHQLTAGPAGQGHSGSFAVDLGKLLADGDGEPIGVGGFQHPLALSADPDRNHVVRFGVDRRQHAGGGSAGDGMFARTAAENDGNARSGLAALVLAHDPADPIGPQCPRAAPQCRS